MSLQFLIGEHDRPPPPGVHLELDTFEDLGGRGEELAEWAARARERVLDPLHMATVAARNEGDGPRTEWGRPGGVFRGVETEPDLGSSGDFESDWRSALSALRAGSLQSFLCSLHTLDDNGYPSAMPGPAFLRVEDVGAEHDVAAWTVTLTVSRALYPAAIEPSVQHAWVDLIRGGARAFSAATGYLTVDHVDDSSPYEQSIGRDWLDGLEESRTLLRGYYWGNILSGQHVNAVGGIERVRDEAPCAFVDDFGAEPWQLVYLQLTHDLDDIPDEALRRLRDYLGPLLPTAARDFRYVGVPLRIVR
jgi:hypothetical protein